MEVSENTNPNFEKKKKTSNALNNSQSNIQSEKSISTWDT